VTVITMSEDGPAPWHDPVVCGVCNLQLLPLSYPITANYGRNGGRPYLKCSGWGVRYQWQDSAH
jgi:hypothetical protein